MNTSEMIGYLIVVLLYGGMHWVIGTITWSICDVTDERTFLAYAFCWPIVLPVKVLKSLMYVIKGE